MLLTPENIKRIKESIRIRGERPAHVQIQEMIDQGVIDKEGNVLLRMPEWGGQMYPGQPRPVRRDDPDQPDGSA